MMMMRGRRVFGVDALSRILYCYTHKHTQSQQLALHIETGIIPTPPPKIVWYLIGTNNLFHNCSATASSLPEEEVYVSSIMNIAQRIHAKVNRKTTASNTIIVVQGLLPRGELLGQRGLKRTAQTIRLVNDRLRGICEKHHRLHYFEPPNLFITANTDTDDNGNATMMIDMNLLEDGVHPSVAGYYIMGKLIEREVRALLKHTVKGKQQ